MNAASIAKDFVGLQKQSVNSIIDAANIFQDQAERAGRLLAGQLGFNERLQAFADRWRTVLTKRREDTKKLINDNFTLLEDYFAALAQKKTI